MNERSRCAGKGTETVRGFRLEPDYYHHPKHVWIALSPEDGNEARIGIDDFAARLIGRIARASVPVEGMPVKENAVCFLLHPGERTVRLVAPASGSIRAVNPGVAADPSLINRDPYGEGWIFSLRPEGRAVDGLYHGDVARRWLESEVERLQRIFASDLGMTATDGGEALADISDRLTDARWAGVIRQFLG
jgi:glycine cleavage system H protein